MATVTLPPKTFVNLYAAADIIVGTQIEVINLTADNVRLFGGASQPNDTSDYVPCQYRRPPPRNTAGDTGAWAWSLTGGGVFVQEVVA